MDMSEEIKLNFEENEEFKKQSAEEIGKRVAWELLDAKTEIHNLSSYARSIIRKQENCSLLILEPSKDLRLKYGIPLNHAYMGFVWWVLEQIEKGNIKIQDDV